MLSRYATISDIFTALLISLHDEFQPALFSAGIFVITVQPAIIH